MASTIDGEAHLSFVLSCYSPCSRVIVLSNQSRAVHRFLGVKVKSTRLHFHDENERVPGSPIDFAERADLPLHHLEAGALLAKPRIERM